MAGGEEKKNNILKFWFHLQVTERRNLDLLATKMVSPKPFRSQATDYGKKYEPVAIEKFQQLVGPTRECGLIVHKDYPWIAASPDGMLLGSNSLLEVKCPYTARDKSIDNVTVPYLKKSDAGLTLDKKHSYYYQVQGQLACSEADSCYFCVFTHKDFKVKEIARDDKFICDMIQNLEGFYNDHFKKALVQKHLHRFYDKYF